jgi:hypothetical protein
MRALAALLCHPRGTHARPYKQLVRSNPEWPAVEAQRQVVKALMVPTVPVAYRCAVVHAVMGDGLRGHEDAEVTPELSSVRTLRFAPRGRTYCGASARGSCGSRWCA